MSNFVRLSRLKLRFKKMDQQTMSKHNANGCMLEVVESITISIESTSSMAEKLKKIKK